MATEIYLGNPPQHVIDWIKAHSKPVVKAETHIKFVDGTEGDYLIEGAMDWNALIAAGLMESPPYWIDGLKEVEIGSAVTSLGSGLFYSHTFLTSVTIPDSVTKIEDAVFHGCSALTSITFYDKDKATVQGMANYNNWGLNPGCVLHCTDGDITI